MSDHPLEARLISHRLIADLAARTALDTPGVLRLEPTLKGLLSHLGTGTIQNLRRADTRTTSARHDGVFVTVHNGIADVQLDIATDIAFAALDVAQAVREQIARTISHTGLIPGRIDISVLAIEHAPTAHRGPSSQAPPTQNTNMTATPRSSFGSAEDPEPRHARCAPPELPHRHGTGMNSEPNNQENPAEENTGGSGRHQGKAFWTAAILLPPALLLCGVWMLLIANYILAGVLFFAAMASLAYFAANRRRSRPPPRP